MGELRCENVSLYYKHNPALKEVSFTIPANTICGLLGRNGAGKTSLMSLIASYRQPTSGKLTYEGRDIFDNPNVMPDINFIYSKEGGTDNRSVKELFRQTSILRPNWDEEYAQALLSESGISAEEKLSSLSQGMQATVWGIVGIAARTPITLYDEAYYGMDAAVRNWFVQEILEDYLRHPRTILFSTHFINEVENVLGEVLILDKGKVLLHENTDDFRDKGTTVTGDREEVQKLVASFGKEPLSSHSLGSQMEVVLYGQLSQELKALASEKNLTLSQPSLQDIFVHLTNKGDDHYEK